VEIPDEPLSVTKSAQASNQKAAALAPVVAVAPSASIRYCCLETRCLGVPKPDGSCAYACD
jgi:hypothetical protein